MPRKEIVGETFRTVLINRRKRPVVVLEADGSVVCQLARIGQPGAERVLEACDPRTLYAPYDECIWESNGTITLKPAPFFIPVNYGKYPLTIFNVDGDEVEHRTIAGQVIFIPRGIPVTIGLVLTDEEVIHREMKIVKVEKMVPSSKVRGIYEFQRVLRDEWVNRTEKEIEAIVKAKELT